MPELPDVEVYRERLAAFTEGEVLRQIRLQSPFVLRTVEPPLDTIQDKKVVGLRRLGKRLVLELEDTLFVVIHLMIAGRLRWKKPNAKQSSKVGLAAFDFDKGCLVFTEASTKKRASIHLVQGEEGLEPHRRGGLEVLSTDLSTFSNTLTLSNHTLKRALTDPRILSGIGNAYSDEILFEAGLSPFKQTQHLEPPELKRLFEATQTVLRRFTEAIRQEVGDGFPDKVTAFREDMMVHGRYREPCKVCGTKVQRVAYAENEMNYCPHCQNQGRLLADRSLSRLMKKDWPKTVEDMEALHTKNQGR